MGSGMLTGGRRRLQCGKCPLNGPSAELLALVVYLAWKFDPVSLMSMWMLRKHAFVGLFLLRPFF